MLQKFFMDEPNIMDDISTIIKESELCNDTSITVMEHIKEYMGYKQYNSILTFIEEHAIHDDTWQFWARFIFEDCMAYINLFTTIQEKNWHLRVTAIKLMHPCLLHLTTHVMNASYQHIFLTYKHIRKLY